jgi:hypothetical protein
LRAVDLRAVDFRAVVFAAGFRAVEVFRAVVLRAVDFRAVVFAAGFRAVEVFRAVVLRAVVLRAVVFRAVDFAAPARFAAGFLGLFLPGILCPRRERRWFHPETASPYRGTE